jgi:hypothetical protein
VRTFVRYDSSGFVKIQRLCSKQRCHRLQYSYGDTLYDRSCCVDTASTCHHHPSSTHLHPADGRIRDQVGDQVLQEGGAGLEVGVEHCHVVDAVAKELHAE